MATTTIAATAPPDNPPVATVSVEDGAVADPIAMVLLLLLLLLLVDVGLVLVVEVVDAGREVLVDMVLVVAIHGTNTISELKHKRRHRMSDIKQNFVPMKQITPNAYFTL